MSKQVGVFLRMDASLHRALRLATALRGESMGAFVSEAVAAKLSALPTAGDRREGAPEAAEGVGHDPSRA